MTIDQYTDQEIVAAILRRDTYVTKEFLYKKCYPLFASIYSRYYTNCDNVLEFINEVYLLLIYKNDKTGHSKLETFGGRCSLPMWIKIVTINYCKYLYKRKIDTSDNLLEADRKTSSEYSLEKTFNTLSAEDVKRVMLMMPNERYRQLIKYRYMEEMSNEETAQTMTLSMANYYNVHLRAKAQFCSILKKEGLL